MEEDKNASSAKSASIVMVALDQLGVNLNTLEGHLNTIYSMLNPFMKPDLASGVSGALPGKDQAHPSKIYLDVMNKNLRVIMMSILAKSMIDRAEL